MAKGNVVVRQREANPQKSQSTSHFKGQKMNVSTSN